jgi:hypothetical protein
VKDTESTSEIDSFEFLKRPDEENKKEPYEQIIEVVRTVTSDAEELPKVEPPFLEKNIMDHPYTLVLDLDETLIHFISANEDKENSPDEGQLRIL